MSRHKKLIRKPKAALSGLLAAAVIASGAGFIYITAPWSSPEHAQEIKPVPVVDYKPGSDDPGNSADGVQTVRFGNGDAPAASSDGEAGVFSDLGASPVRVGSAPMAPAQANDKGAGDFAKIPGTSSGSWGVKGQTGGFTYDYPFSLREAPAGATPALGISYDSSRVDGLTSATNNQASVVGDGWALSGTGTIRQKFGSCNDQGVTTSYDLCGNKEGQSFSISFGGRSGEIIMDPTQPPEKRFKLQNDDNTKLEYLTGAANGTFDGGYWRITDTAGTQYWFGVNRIPGWSPGKDNYSTDIVPVYGLPGQPCYKDTGFGNSSCMQAYAWNLDYVVDLNGNSQGYFYKQDTNFYKSQGGSGTLKAYHRASRLERVDYGMRAGTELSTQAPLHVTYGYTGRCTSVTCSWGSDVPETTKFICASTSTTCAMQSPTFFTDQRLVTVVSQALSVNPAGYGDLDYWTFYHTMPDPGDTTKPALWLWKILHEGTNRTSTAPGTGFVVDPHIIFEGQLLQNRVWTVDGLAPLNRGRLSYIKTATGATTTVTYTPGDCTIEDANNNGVADILPENNTKRCFPQWWTPTTPVVQNSRRDFFHIYPVKSVVTNGGPGTNGSPDLVINYSYEGAPAWKYAAPKYVSGTGGSQLTWSVPAGWSKVKTTVGSAAEKPTTVTTYLRGLDGTPSNTTGGLRSVSVTASDGTLYYDSPWFAGREIEKETFVGEGGAWLGTTITAPWASAPTATSSAALGGIPARHTGTAWVKTQAATSTSVTQRISTATTSFDPLGRPLSSSNTGETAVAGDETCTATTYADNVSMNLLALPATVKTYAGLCTAPGSPTGNVLAGVRTLYDGSAAAEPGTTGYTSPTKGNVARTDNATTVSGAAVAVWKQGPSTGYDALGRATTSTDNSTGTPRTTTTTYAPASGLATTVKVTNHKLWESITTLDSMRGLPLTTKDANLSTTSYRYDAAGRVTGEWGPLRPQATNPTPGVETSYSISQTAPSWVKVTKLSSDEAATSSYTLYDGLGRVRQTQRMSPGEGTIATDTWYDSRGDKSRVNNDYYLSPNPDGILKIPSLAVPSSTEYVYDGARRPTAIKTVANDNVLLWTTQMSYQGADTTTITGPGTEAATTTVKNLNGEVESRKLFHGPTASGTADTSKYTYDAIGQLTGMTDTAGNAWSWTFDAAGREISAVDPDSGARSTTYDAAGRKASTTDAANVVIGYVYDDMDRVLKKTLGTGAAAPPLEAYTYDGNKKGQLSTAKRYNGTALNQVVTTTVTGYNAAYQPGTVSVQLPAALDAAEPTYTTSRVYTTTGKIEEETRPTIGAMPGETVGYVYNRFDIQTSVLNGSFDTYVGDTQFNKLGQIDQYAQYDNNNTVGGTANTTGRNQINFTWDATTGRLTNQWSTNNTRNVASDLGKTTYTYNPAGKLTARELSFSSRPSTPSDYQCYKYDHASRLAAVWTPTAKTCTTAPTGAETTIAGISGPAAYAQTYKYTPIGDRAEVKRFNSTGALAVTENYTYASAGAAGPHRVQKIDTLPTTGTASTQNFIWDTTGKMTDRAGQTLTYTPDGRLATSTGDSTVPANPNPNAGTGTPAPVGPATTATPGERFYDASGNLVGIKDGTGTTITIGSVTAHTSTTNDKTATCTYTFAGKTVAQRTVSAAGSKLAFIIGDTVNTAQTMTLPTTGTGPLTTLTRYTDPLGLTRGANSTATANNPYTTAPAATAGVGSNGANPAGFGATNGYISGLDDAASSLTHLGARELDPVTGIFTSPDPVLDRTKQERFTPYTYAFGDLINVFDPTGLAIQIPISMDGGGGPWDGDIYRQIMAEVHNVVVPHFDRPPTYNPLIIPKYHPVLGHPVTGHKGLNKSTPLPAHYNEKNMIAIGVLAGMACPATGGITCFIAGSLVASGLESIGRSMDGETVSADEAAGAAGIGVLIDMFCRKICGLFGKLGAPTKVAQESAEAAAKAVEPAAIPFRTDTGHIFRQKENHFPVDTPENRAVIQDAVENYSYRETITLAGGGTLDKYFKSLPDGTQAWGEVLNGSEITNGGLNIVPR